MRSFSWAPNRDLNDKANKDNKKRRQERPAWMYHFVQMTHISPHCAGILYKCLQNLEKKVSKIVVLSSSTKEVHFKDVRHMGEVNKSIKLINEKFEDMKKERKEKERDI